MTTGEPPDSDSHPTRRKILHGLGWGGLGLLATATLPPLAAMDVDIATQQPLYVQPRMRGNQGRKYVLILGDSFAEGLPFRYTRNVPWSPGAIAAKRLGFRNYLITDDGAGPGTLLDDQIPAAAKLIKKHGPPALVVVSMEGNRKKIDYSVALLHAYFGWPHFNEATNSGFLDAVQNKVPGEVKDAVNELYGITEGAKTLWQGLPYIFRKNLKGPNLMRGPFGLDYAREDNLVASVFALNNAIQAGIDQTDGKGILVPIANAIGPRDVYQDNDFTLFVHWIAAELSNIDPSLDTGFLGSHPMHLNKSGVLKVAEIEEHYMSMALEQAGFSPPDLSPGLTRRAALTLGTP